MTYKNVQLVSFFSLLIGVSGLFLWMLGKYLFPVFWAVVFAVIFYPLFQRIERITGRFRSLAAILTIILLCILVIAPIAWIGGMVVSESLSIYKAANTNGTPIDLAVPTAWITEYLAPYGITETMIVERLQTWIQSGAAWFSASFIALSQVTLTLLIHIGIMVYLLFFMFRDGLILQQKLIDYLPLGDEYERRLITRFADTTRAVVSGTLAIAALQGVIGGVALWIAGLNTPILWGVAMMILAIIPAVGPMLVWLPAGLYLLLTGSVWAGVFVLVVGVLLVSIVDEFLRPTLVGRRTNMPDAFILLATVGGLATFGASGLVVGPVIAAFFLSLWSMFAEQYHAESSVLGDTEKASNRRNKQKSRT